MHNTKCKKTSEYSLSLTGLVEEGLPPVSVVVPDPGPCHRSSAAQNHPGGPGDAVVVPAGASSTGAAKAVRAVRGAAILNVETGR